MTILLFCAIAPLMAKTTFTAGVGAGTSLYLGIGRYGDSIPIRSSIRIDARFDFGLNWKDRLSASIEIPIAYVSPSPVYDGTIRRQFLSFGCGLRFLYRCGKRIGIVASSSIQYNQYFVDQAFLSFEVSAGPTFLLAQSERWRLSIDTPVQVQCRKEIIGLGIGFILRGVYEGADL